MIAQRGRTKNERMLNNEITAFVKYVNDITNTKIFQEVVHLDRRSVLPAASISGESINIWATSSDWCYNKFTSQPVPVVALTETRSYVLPSETYIIIFYRCMYTV